jgi:hypothetical protein
MCLLRISVISFGRGEKIYGNKKKQIQTAICMAIVILFFLFFKLLLFKNDKTKIHYHLGTFLWVKLFY